MLIATSFLSGCVKGNYSSVPPTFPKAGEKVATELEQIPYEGFEDTWDWIGRLDKLSQELEIYK